MFYGNTAEDTEDAGFDDALLYRLFKLPREARSLRTSQLLREEATESFTLWQASPLRIDY